MKNKRTAYDVITDRVVELLDQGVCPWSKPWRTVAGRSTAPVSIDGRRYSGINVWVLGCQGYESPVWMTFKAAKRHGGNVRKGEHGTPVVYYKVLDKTKTVDGEERVDRIFFLRYYTVFNLDQTEGVKVPEPLAEATTLPEEPADISTVLTAAEAIAAGYLKAPKAPGLNEGGNRAAYNPTADAIWIPKRGRFTSPAERYSTLFHEMGHSTGHPDRLNRPGIAKFDGFGSHAYSYEELVAEMTATYLCAEAGIVDDTIENSAAYLKGWASKLRESRQMVVKAASAAQKAANLVLGRIPGAEADDEAAATPEAA